MLAAIGLAADHQPLEAILALMSDQMTGERGHFEDAPAFRYGTRSRQFLRRRRRGR